MGLLVAYLVALVLTLLALRLAVQIRPYMLLRVLRWVALGGAFGLAAWMLYQGHGPLALGLAATGLFLWGLMRDPMGAETLASLNHSIIETNSLRAETDRETGRMQARVLRGIHVGRSLDDLTPVEVLRFWRETARQDPLAAQLVERYLDGHYPDWRRDAAKGMGGLAPGDETSLFRDDAPDWRAGRALIDGGMDKAQALIVLGLRGDPTDKAIIEAHRKLMRVNHPDRGGAPEQAARINQARDRLLRRV